MAGARHVCVQRSVETGVLYSVQVWYTQSVVQAAPARSLRQSYQVSQSGHFPRLALRKQISQTASVSPQSAHGASQLGLVLQTPEYTLFA